MATEGLHAMDNVAHEIACVGQLMATDGLQAIDNVAQEMGTVGQLMATDGLQAMDNVALQKIGCVARHWITTDGRITGGRARFTAACASTQPKP